jgi:acyl carrier protein
MDDVREAIRQYILSNHLQGESPENLRDQTPLLTSGILDSLAALGLASFIHERFGVELDADEMSVERFDRFADIASLVEKKLVQSR